MPPSKCAVPGCPRHAVKRGRCDEHAGQASRAYFKRYDAERRPAHDPRNTARWRNARAAYLAAHPLCENDQAHRGLGVFADEVDHRVPIANGGAPFDQANLQALCRGCHALKTARERAR